MKILIVEDDLTMATTVSDLFSVAYHYAVDVAADGKRGLEMAEMLSYDLIILDILLPQLDGITVCKRLRDQGFTMPILLLTGEDGSHTIAKAINLGADDYMVKPFNAEELMARVQALLRRGGPNLLPLLNWGDLVLNPNTRSVTYLRDSLNFPPKEYAILELFLRNGEQVFSPKVIINQVWSSDRFPGEEVIRVHIKSIRAKLKSMGAPPDFIKTVYRVGYRLNPLYEGTHHQSSKGTESTEVPQLSPSAELAPHHTASHQEQVLPSPQPELSSEERVQAIEMKSSQGSNPTNTLVHDLNNVFGAILASVQYLQYSDQERDAVTKEQLGLIEKYSKLGAKRVKRFFIEQEGRKEE